ncbi:MAG: AAA family ATPase [Candidatus Nezhaarchaeota archaeon]|nr:AAA family ATPase [Candidatus Nezhaarchaeota archaeon]MCX8142568.1 AAA family ATPase [Candidatus Nezhaarchaeota archaeon]
MSRIFIDRDKLSPSYIPGKLPHREAQLKALFDLFDFSGFSDVYPKSVQVIGPTGSGKTSSCIRFGKLLEQRALGRGLNLKSIYVNLRLEGSSRFMAFKSMVEKVAFEAVSRSLSPDEVLKQFIEVLRARKLMALIIMDEVDFHVRRCKETVVYDLTRISELSPAEGSNVLGVIFIARDLDWIKLLDPSERSTLGNIRVLFPPYTRSQVLDILEYRASEALASGAVSRDVLEFISDIAVQPPRNGDIRFALDLLLYSGVLAEQQGFDHITIDHVRSVYGKMIDMVSLSDFEELSLEEKLTLLSLARILSASKTPYVPLKEVESQLPIILSEFGVRINVQVDKAVKRLHERGFIELSDKRVGVLIGPLSKLISLLEDLISRVVLSG